MDIMNEKRRLIAFILSLFIPVTFFIGENYFTSKIHHFEKKQTVEPTEKEYGYTLYIIHM